jgi:signal transduction histidine kinase
LAAILDAVPTPIFLAHDPDCLHITGNRAADKLLRHSRGAEASLTAAEDIRPRHFRTFKDGRELSTAELPAQRAARGTRVEGFEFSIVFNDGTTYEVLAYATPLLDDEGRSRGAINVLVDITDQKLAEQHLRTKSEELRATTQQLWQAARLAGVGELAASIAHELNNPLGTISLRIEGLLAKTPSDDARRRPLEVIEGEVERMGNLVANLLQFSRAGVDRVSTVDVCEEIRKALELVEHLLRKQRIRVEPEFAIATPLIHADRQQLRQILLNLFTNATDAMPDGGRLMPRVRPGTLPSGVPAVTIEVADTGMGISPELLPRVTESFFTTKPEGKGTGLGLAICRRIVQQHHGTLEVESRLGEGTTIRITLPVRSDTNVGGLNTA